MYNHFTLYQWLNWAAILCCQLVVAVAARRRCNALSIYLTGLGVASACGMLCAVFSSAATYRIAYSLGGFLEIGLTGFLLIQLAEEVRSRAIPGRNDAVTYALLLLILGVIAGSVSHIPSGSSAEPTLLAVMRSTGYSAYSWMSLILAVLPFYAFAVLAIPKRETVLQLVALALVIAEHATFLDRLFQGHADNIVLLKTFHDLGYFLPLSLWFLSFNTPRFAFLGHLELSRSAS